MSNKYIELDKKNKIKSEQIKEVNKHFNLGILVYLFILFYLIFCVISFTTGKKVNYTIAESSKIVDSESFQGMILRDESIYYAKKSGNVTFFFPDGTKVKKNAMLAIVGDENRLSKALQSGVSDSVDALSEKIRLSNDDYENLGVKLRNFTTMKDEKEFIATYYTKYELQKAINDISNTVLMEGIGDFEVLKNTQNALEEKITEYSSTVKAKEAGIISYDIDGLENIHIDNYSTSDMRKEMDKQLTSIKNNVNEDDQLFKIIHNHEWYIVAEINDKLAKYIRNNDNKIKINIGNYERVHVTVSKVFYENNRIYTEFELTSLLEEYLDERFIDFTVVYNETKGIKIPNSSVIEKPFYKLPRRAITIDGNNLFVHKIISSKDALNNETVAKTMINYVLFEEEYVYVSFDNNIEKGDIVYTYKNDMVDYEYTIDSFDLFEGVYIINQGFVEYKPIETIYLDEDYRIISDHTEEGLLMFDRVVIESNDVNENDFIY